MSYKATVGKRKLIPWLEAWLNCPSSQQNIRSLSRFCLLKTEQAVLGQLWQHLSPHFCCVSLGYAEANGFIKKKRWNCVSFFSFAGCSKSCACSVFCKKKKIVVFLRECYSWDVLSWGTNETSRFLQRTCYLASSPSYNDFKTLHCMFARNFKLIF